MALNNPYAAYQQNSINMKSPGELTLMLYDGCLKFMKLAKQAIEQGDMEMKNTNLVKAQNIIQELNVTLNREVELAGSMGAMYEYIYRRLIEANINNDKDIVTEVEGYVKDFRDAWKQAIQIERQGRFGTGGHV
ncbi:MULTISPECIES: flagellar export chaperone FliS [Bacillus]|uniref:Flagellar secretion chaperone FliS n=1 Tax=Bacillus glycinifermentans TaxID=1664069 RepID=A0AAJ3Z377_9BACI|nr:MULTISPECIES: flagellar export chaperone FliS [Bacillus]KKB75079.1 flagellar biosynthesis protein FliS [Bacillus sp. TH008]MBU8787524.1 flagellar export chaperone FliS [Bacillus glycinifermentans]MDU0070380.1 flagellar export chaperone FliS [Bacillus sp. IG6]MED8018178.1 flagellar export chaperone FliS [Bacillus glycinifermentans]NUJ16335.1 flagellar export chaperone FliS [Bacillus glycinifermentans]